MIKTGIYKLSQLQKNTKTLFGKQKNVSITLYDQILDEPQAEKFAERILLLFSDERGAYKRTYQKRFEVFDQQAIDVLENLFKPGSSLFLHDVGVSDGRTALDFFEKIVSTFPSIDYLATDYSHSVYVIKKGALRVTLSHAGDLLEITLPPFVFIKMKRDSYRHYPLNHLVRVCLEKFFVAPLVRQYLQKKIIAKELVLFAPKVLKKSKEDDRFHLGRYDLLQPFKKSFSVIRVMNVLNPSYFSEMEFKIVVRNLYDGLRDNGVLITGSNHDPDTLVCGGIYQKIASGFKTIFKSGDGSPIERAILSFKP